LLAYLYLKIGNLDESEKLYQKLLIVSPDDFSILNNEAAILARRGLFKEAIEELDKVLSIEPNCGEAYANKGTILVKMGDLKGGIKCLNMALKVKPTLGYVDELVKKILSIHPELMQKKR